MIILLLSGLARDKFYRKTIEKKLSFGMFVLIIFGNIIECSSIDGSLIGSECNIVHACDSQGKPHNN